MQKLVGKIQKLMGWAGTIAFGLMAIYALGMATPAACCLYYEDTINFYSSIQPYNDAIIYWAIAGIVVSLLHNVFRNNTRKIYYISNFIWIILFAIVSIGSAITLFVDVSYYQALYSALPFEAMNQYWSELNISTHINPNTPIFILGYLEAVLLIIVEVASFFVGINKLIERIKYEKARRDEHPLVNQEEK